MNKNIIFAISSLLLVSCASNNLSVTTKDSSDIESNEESSSLTSQSVLVAYFSATNNTKTLAIEASNHLNSDIFEIVPANPYSSADLNYNDSSSRVSIENNGPSIRPEISSNIEDISKYDTIVLGYPIWWGKAPRIVLTFVESYDFSSKRIIPFATSASSPIGTSVNELKEAAPSATFLEGRRFSTSMKDSFLNWLDENI